MSDSPNSVLHALVEASLPSGHRRARVLANRPEGRDAVRLDVAIEGPWSHRPGQVAELAVVAGDEGFFAIASAPAESGTLTFLVRAGGSISEPLMSLREGDVLLLRGPHGRGYELDDTDSPLLLVGVGSALSALRSALLHALGSAPRKIALVLGVRTRADLAFANEVEGWRARGVDVTLIESQGGPDTLAGHVQDHLGAIAQALPGALVLLAGSESFEDEVTGLLVAARVSPARIQRNFRRDGRAETRSDGAEASANA